MTSLKHEKPVYPGVIAYPSFFGGPEMLKSKSRSSSDCNTTTSTISNSAEEFKLRLKRDEAFMSEEQIRERYHEYWRSKQVR